MSVNCFTSFFRKVSAKCDLKTSPKSCTVAIFMVISGGKKPTQFMTECSLGIFPTGLVALYSFNSLILVCTSSVGKINFVICVSTIFAIVAAFRV